MRASSCATPRSASSSLAVRAASSPAAPLAATRKASGATLLRTSSSSIRSKAAGAAVSVARAGKKDDSENDRFDPDAAPSFADSEFAGMATVLAFVAVFGGALALLVSLARPVIDNTLNSIPVR